MKISNLKISIWHTTTLLLCTQQIVAGTGNPCVSDGTSDIRLSAPALLTADTNNIFTLEVEKFLRENISKFISARKKFMYEVPKTKYASHSVLELLGKNFPDYTFSTKYLQNDYFYTGYGQQILTVGKVGYRSQIRYYCNNTNERLTSVISLRFIYNENGEALCETIGYTTNPESNFLHSNEPTATINVFRDIMAMEEQTLTKTANGEIPIKQARNLIERFFATIACCK
jgi:hypothetical protein